MSLQSVDDILKRMRDRGTEPTTSKEEALQQKAAEDLAVDLKKKIMAGIRGAGIKQPECTFLGVDKRGVFNYELNFKQAKCVLKMAPEHEEAFKAMALHFLKACKEVPKPVSFITDPGRLFEMGNLPTADEACKSMDNSI